MDNVRMNIDKIHASLTLTHLHPKSPNPNEP